MRPRTTAVRRASLTVVVTAGVLAAVASACGARYAADDAPNADASSTDAHAPNEGADGSAGADSSGGGTGDDGDANAKNDGSRSDGSDAAASGDASASDAGDANNPGDASAGDAGVDAGTCPCDCDGDGYTGVLPTPDCGSYPTGDCDDTNAAVHPGAGYSTDPWPMSSPHTPAYDWNCNGVVEEQLATSLDCAQLSSADGCVKEGFSGNPACGANDTYVTCKAAGLLNCGLATTTTRTQACK